MAHLSLGLKGSPLIKKIPHQGKFVSSIKRLSGALLARATCYKKSGIPESGNR